MCLSFCDSRGQAKIDTLFYDRNWKGVDDKAFASYYRIVSVAVEMGGQKRFRDFYVTGELQSEGQALFVDKYDDAKTVFDGEVVNYYKSGKVQEKRLFVDGVQEGEAVEYKENGLISVHAHFKDGLLHGLYTEFSDDGDVCRQIEFSDGEPLHDYCEISTSKGLYGKFRLSDGTPVYEPTALADMRIEYINGEAWSYYRANGLIVGVAFDKSKAYGKWFQVSISVANHSLNPVNFFPEDIAASLIEIGSGNERELEVWSCDEYMRKVDRRQNLARGFYSLAESMAVSDAGYSASMETSSFRNSFGYGTQVSNTVSYDGAAAYQARVLASNRVADFSDAQFSMRESLDQGYLKATTIQPGETISGFINIKYRRFGSELRVVVNVNGIAYAFSWEYASSESTDSRKR